MRILSLFFFLICFSAFANKDDFITKAVVEDIEIFSGSFNDQEIRILEADARMSFNPFQWLLMVKDLAAGEKRKVVTFKYKAKGKEVAQRGYAVLTYEESESEDESCYRISLNKLVFDTGVFNITGVFPGFKTIRVIEKCENES